MSEQKKKKNYIENDKIEFPYIGLLSDNAPKVSADYYEDASILNEQINKPDTFNVAIMAKYGAGKSSVINTYLSIYRSKEFKKNNNPVVTDKVKDNNADDKEKRAESKSEKDIDESKSNKIKLGKPINNNYARVSLSTFNKTDFDEVAIERSILQQLLYSRKKSELPNSKIERTNKTSRIKSILFAVLLTVFFLAAILTSVEFSLFTREFNKGITTLFCGLPWLKYLLLTITFVSLFVIVLWVLHYRKLKKIKYKDLEADFVHDSEKGNNVQTTNLINKFIDEVLYFFECVDINLVIFEDLDRLPTTEIFVKLRELNTIINNSNKCAKKVTFLYAVKDDLFKTDEERAKFFEFILPVVPVINPVTTVSEIEKKLKKLVEKNPKMQLSSKLIKGVSLYIPDMRVLKNTVNDYIIMYRKIFEDKNSNQYLEADKLFALCVYKNLFPYDYTLLEQKEGLIPKIIDIKTLRTKLTQILDVEIDSIKQKIEKLQTERLKSFDELKTMLNGQLYQFSHVGRGVKPINILNISTFQSLDFSHIMHPVYSGYCINNQKEILTPSGDRYIDREKQINEIEKLGIGKLQNKLSNLEKQKQQITFWSLKEIIEAKGVDFCFNEKIKNDALVVEGETLSADEEDFLKIFKDKFGIDIDEKDLDKLKKDYLESKSKKNTDKQRVLQVNYLRFLLSHDFIDEHFIEYTSNYKAEKLSQSDTKVVQSIQSGYLDFNIQVQNLDEVIKWLDEDDFKQVSILIKPILLNIDIVSKLSRIDKDGKFNNLMNLLSNKEKEVVGETLLEFLCSATLDECDNLLKYLVPIRQTICEEVVNSNILEPSRKDFIIAEHIKYAVNFKTVDNEIIAKYIKEKSNYIEILNSVNDDKKVIKFIEEQSIIFMYLSAVQLEGEIQQFIILNSLYSLTVENLSIVLFGETESSNPDFYSRNYYTVQNSNKKHIIDFVNGNIATYFEEILLDERITCENEPADLIGKLLTIDSIPMDARKGLIKKVKVKFADITVFGTELYNELFINNLVEPTWKNVQFAFEQTGFDSVGEFLKRNSTISGDYVSLQGIKDDTSVNLTNAILINFTKEEISEIANTMPVITKLFAINIENIGDEKLAEYIRKSKINYEKTDLLILKNLPKSLNSYLKVHDAKIMGEFDEFFKEALPNINKQTQQVWENGHYVNKTIINYTEKTHSQKIISMVLDCQDVDNAIKKLLIEKCVEIIKIDKYASIYSDYIIKNRQSVPAKILWQFTNVNMSSEDKLEILSLCNYGGEKVDTKKIQSYLISINASFSTLYNQNKKVKLQKTEKITTLLNKLREKGLIKNYSKVRNKEEYWVS